MNLAGQQKAMLSNFTVYQAGQNSFAIMTFGRHPYVEQPTEVNITFYIYTAM